MTTTTVVTDGMQQPGTNVIIIQQPNRFGRFGGYSTATWGPVYLRQGLRVGGFAMGIQLIVCIGATGALFTFAGIMMVSMDADKEFWSKFNRSHGPATVMGSILLVIGVSLMIACGVIFYKAKKKYEKMKKDNPNTSIGDALSGDNPGRVYNQNQNQNQAQNPGQYSPVHNPGQHSPMPPGAAPYGMNVGGQVPPGQVPPYPQPGYNPNMGGYPTGQPAPYPSPQPSPIPGAGNPQSVPPYPAAPYGGPAQYPSNPEAPEYNKPPPFAPDYKP